MSSTMLGPGDQEVNKPDMVPPTQSLHSGREDSHEDYLPSKWFNSISAVTNEKYVQKLGLPGGSKVF